MDKASARILLKSLVERFGQSPANVFLTPTEADAIRVLLGLDLSVVQIGSGRETSIAHETEEVPEVIFRDPVLIDDGHMMCLDFGTSFSKAFACTTSKQEEVPQLFALSFGTTTRGDPQLLLPSELFVDGGRLYLGSAARERFDAVAAPQERLIDSPKQFITLNQDVSELGVQLLDEAKDPSRTLMKRDALVLYLAHLNALAEQSLEEQGLSADLRRRYAHPAWRPEHFEKNSEEMRRIMAEAIAIGRCFKDEVVSSLSVKRAKSIAEGARTASSELLPFGLLGDPVLEATAAGAGALIGTERGNRQAYVILDIGAGTTDVASCVCIHDANRDTRRVIEVRSGRNAIPQAGNIIDNVLLKLILSKSALAEKTPEHEQVQSGLKRSIRSNKEILFNDGAVTVELVTGEVIEVTVDELLARSEIVNLFKRITDLVEHAALCVAVGDAPVRLAATGGGAALPVVKSFEGMSFTKNNRRARLSLVDPMPEILQEPYPGLRGPYPQIAVAVGGALPELPEQKDSVPDFTPDPGRKVIGPMYKK